MALLERGGAVRLIAAALLFVLGGAMVEFWWPEIAMTISAWRVHTPPNMDEPVRLDRCDSRALRLQSQPVGACGSATHLPGAAALDHDAAHAPRVLCFLPAVPAGPLDHHEVLTANAVALEWTGALLGLLGGFLLATHTSISRYGWFGFLGANLAMTSFAIAIGAHGVLVHQRGFTATTLLGIHRSGLWARTRPA